MSLPDSEETRTEEKPAPPTWRTGWTRWRKLMLAGALVLLALSLMDALMEPDPPTPVKVIGLAAGYVLLALGFGQRMRDRRRS